VTQIGGDQTASFGAAETTVARATLEMHFKLFGTDGVSLQSQELSKALSKRGWSVHACAADVPPDAEGLRVPELSYQSQDAVALRKRLFSPLAEPSQSTGASTGAALVEEITDRAKPIRQQVERYVRLHQIPLLHVRNLMSLPYNLPATLAIYGLADDRPDISFLMQHHDLYWEGPNARNFRTPYREVAELLDQIMCPSLPNVRHVLINPIAAEALRDKTGIEGTVVPDGFDFDRDVAIIDELAFRSRLEILVGDSRPVDAHDLVVAMPARVAINKAIELAIQFVAGLEHKRAALEDAPEGIGLKRRRFTAASRIVLLLPQGEDLDDNRDYFERLQAYAAHSRITLAYGGDIVVPDRRFHRGDADHYPFYSTYQAVDLVCYSPEHEGFGNQAIEAVWAERPLAILEYPVFQRFVRDHVPHYISLGDTSQLGRLEEFDGLHQLAPDILDDAVDGAIAVLKDHNLERTWTEENFRALRAFCGMDTVAAAYIRLYGDMGVGDRS
jgi:mannosylglucosylglycerate synthase